MSATFSTEPVEVIDGADSVLVYIDTLRLSRVDGWLRCDVDIEPEPAARRRLGFGFYRSDTVHATATISGSADSLADRWGPPLEGLLDGALTGIEPHADLKRLRFVWDDDGLRVRA